MNGSASIARIIPTMSAAPCTSASSAIASSTIRPTMKTLARLPTISLARLPNGIINPCGMQEGAGMPSKKYKPEQIGSLLRQIEVAVANGKSTPQGCRDVGISEQSYYRWRKEYGGLRLDQAKRLKELEKEHLKLKRRVAELSLEKQILKDVAEGNY